MTLAFIAIVVALCMHMYFLYGEKNQLEKDNKEMKRSISVMVKKQVDRELNQRIDHEVGKRLVSRLRVALPQIAIAKQFYIKGPSLSSRIDQSVRMTKEEFMLAFPELYGRIFDKVKRLYPNKELVKKVEKITATFDDDVLDVYGCRYSALSKEVLEFGIEQKSKPPTRQE